MRRPQQATVFYPLVRLARVISQGPVDWHCEALLGCAEAGVPVVFLRGDGAVRAYAFGGRRLGRDPHDLLYTRLRARLARPGGMARYGAWRDAMMQVALRVLHRRLGDALTDCRADGPALGFAAIWSGVAGAQECASIERRLHGLLAGLSAQLLAEAGLDAARWCKLDFEFDLAGDLAALLGWALAEPVFLTLRDRAGGVSVLDLNDQRQLIALFEIHAEDLRRLGRRWLHQLRQWLETCEPWREGGGFI
ncbi:MAG: hypothetical protein IPI57_14660 [Candidatus Competibacteraceae bacterium]|nr:hypothetical protein [Candidatus Competibacteraceae bacterium]